MIGTSVNLPLCRTFRRPSTRGLAFLEVTMFLPLLVALLLGTLYVARLYTQKLETLTAVRRCAWVIASSGCQSVPADCRSQRSQNEVIQKKLEDRLSQVAEPHSGEPPLPVPAQRALTTGTHGIMMERVSAKDERTVARPRLFGGETVKVGSTFSLPCNSKNAEVWEAGLDVFKSFL